MKSWSLPFIAFLSILICSCKQETLPKPLGQLRLEYPHATYKPSASPYPFYFENNTISKVSTQANGSIEIKYPKMKATIYLTYKKVDGNIKSLLRDVQKLTYNHVIKADDILEQPYLNPSNKVYGMLYQINGNAATNAEFYATDSVKHFLTGSVYFYVKPNFDSIYPASEYVKKDLRHLMETLKWK
ncbi:MAG: gliding motility lipoprotein GldD [Flavobacterium sp. BFFFF2]|nr:MAG: gliding motility lipoprotein GldD [Flavobacterium sp. BFFFF2]